LSEEDSLVGGGVCCHAFKIGFLNGKARKKQFIFSVKMHHDKPKNSLCKLYGVNLALNN
jgi:hypothetical protein